MPLSSGEKLGPYEILAPLGAGGMGEVYKARDTRLDRLVAVKTSRTEFGERFEREAHAVAALNHANICTLHDVGPNYLVMEYIEGSPLKGPLLLDQALKYGVQICDALDAAHKKGITHRDLKPANILVTKAGIKLLDFGLAKLSTTAQAAKRPSEATLTMALTGRNEIVGTLYYMSPEQLQAQGTGQEIDGRSDIFSFGLVLYEMLTGKRVFEGSSPASVIAAIMERPAPSIADVAPPALDRTLRKCLEKDPDARWQSARDLKDELQWIAGASTGIPAVKQPARPPRRREIAAWVAASIFLAGLAAAIWLRSPSGVSNLPLTRVTWDAGVSASPAISPDGQLLAYSSDRDGQNNLDLYVQRAGGGTPVRLTHTDEDESEPAFSPDGSSIAFSSSAGGDSIYVIPALGGEPRLLVRGGHSPRYSPDGNWIVYWSGPITSGNPTAEGMGRVFMIPSSGGTPRQIRPEFLVARWPVWSPDGRLIVFQGVAPGNSSDAFDRFDYWVTPVEGGKAESSGLLARLHRAKMSSVLFELTSWTRDGLYFNLPLGVDVTWGGDAKKVYRCHLDGKGRASGDVVQLTGGTAVDGGAVVSGGGRMVFASGGQRVNVWGLPVEANTGKVTGPPYRITDGLAPTIHPDLSPDGHKLLFDAERNGKREVWERDLATGKEAVVVTGRDGVSGGKFLGATGLIRYFGGDDTDVLDPTTGEVRKMNTPGGLGDFARGKKLYLWREDRPLPSFDLLDLSSGKRTPVLQAEHVPLYLAQFSPDERWIVFLAFFGPGHSAIYVTRTRGFQEIPRSDWQPVIESRDPVDKPRFSPDGKLLYFTLDRNGSRSVQAVRFDPGSGRPIGDPFLVYDFRSPRLSMLAVNLSDLELCVAPDKIVMLLAESNWNIWMTELNARP